MITQVVKGGFPMAFFKGDIYSQVLGMNTTLHIIYPENLPDGHLPQTVYLLHGLSDNGLLLEPHDQRGTLCSTIWMLYMACGLEDPLLEVNQNLYHHLQSKGHQVVMEAWEGSHEWAFGIPQSKRHSPSLQPVEN